MRQRAPITAALKSPFLRRSMSPWVRGHLWPLVSTTTAWVVPRTFHPTTHTQKNAKEQLLSTHPCASKATPEVEFQPKHFQPIWSDVFFFLLVSSPAEHSDRKHTAEKITHTSEKPLSEFSLDFSCINSVTPAFFQVRSAQGFASVDHRQIGHGTGTSGLKMRQKLIKM